MARPWLVFGLISFVILGFTSAACAVQHDSSNLVPNNSVVFVQSRAFGDSLGKLAGLIAENGFTSSADGDYLFQPPQSRLTSFANEFGFGETFWKSHLTHDKLLRDGNRSIHEKLKHLFPGRAFFAVVPEANTLVPVFGFEHRNGFDWFAEFQAYRGSRESSDSYPYQDVEIFPSEKSDRQGLFYFRRGDMTYGAYSKSQIERLATVLAGPTSVHKTLQNDRLFLRTNNRLDELDAGGWDLELFVAPKLLRSQANRLTRSIFGTHVPPFFFSAGKIVKNEAPANLNYLTPFIETNQSLSTNLGIVLKLQLDQSPGSCKFAVIRSEEVPLNDADRFLEVRESIQIEKINWHIPFPDETSGLWIVASEKLAPFSGRLTHEKGVNPSLMLSNLDMPAIAEDWMPQPQDRSVHVFFSGGTASKLYPWSFSGMVVPDSLVLLPRKDRGESLEEDVSEDLGGHSVKSSAMYGLRQLRFQAFASNWIVWQRSGIGVAPEIAAMLQSSSSRSPALELNTLRELMLEDPKLEWNIAEVTNRMFPDFHYFFPFLSESDVMIRPDPSLAADTRVPTSGETVIVHDVHQNYRAANKDEFPGLQEDDFFADLWFRIRFQICANWRQYLKPGDSSEYATYLLHNTNLGDGIWLVKGKVVRVKQNSRDREE